MPDKVIHLVFKTHLDIGFTDLAEKVRRQYHEHFIPQAIETGEHFYREDPKTPKFIWTTGAWLIWDHLENADAAAVARLERAIERGLIRWHALPFTTHSELMSPDLFRAGLSYAQELDRRFGIKTIAAKMTDVPGHTRGIVPLLAEAGVRFLHLGVNAASPVPDLPDVFRWRAPSGEEIVVMYQNSYGSTHFPAGFDDGLSFAHTIDNVGPQSMSQTIDVYRHLQSEHPDARIKAATLDEYGAVLWREREHFPVVDLEIGDSWIHGAASDPDKTARFLALQRLYDQVCAEGLTPKRLSFGRRLAIVAEHTWGVDIKTYLRDDLAWDRPAFEAARASDPRFAYAEASWREQAQYLDEAIAALDEDDRRRAGAALALLEPTVFAGAPISASEPLQIGDWKVSIDRTTGDIAGLIAPSGVALAGIDGSLLGFRYESYDHTDIDRHLETYLSQRPDWAILDHGKPGLERTQTARSQRWLPNLAKVMRADPALMISANLPAQTVETFGAPRSVDVILRPSTDDALEIAVVMRAKPANRMPEASFLTLTPRGGQSWEYCKMGLWQKANRIARKGGGQLQAVTGARAPTADGATVEITPLDTPLVAPADTPFMIFALEPPSLQAGIRFNLHNNKWGTNFPMWWAGDFQARFKIRVTAAAR